MNSCVGGLPGANVAAGAGAGAGSAAAGGGAAAAGAAAGTASGAGPAAGAASGAGPTACAGRMPVGRWASVPGMAPAAGVCTAAGAPPPVPGMETPGGSNWFKSPGSETPLGSGTPAPGMAAGRLVICADGMAAPGAGAGAAGSCTKLVTEDATCLELSGVALLPANAAAAAISIDAALVGSAAACWITGLSCCIAGSPGACRALIGFGGTTGSAHAAGVAVSTRALVVATGPAAAPASRFPVRGTFAPNPRHQGPRPNVSCYQSYSSDTCGIYSTVTDTK